MDVQTIIKRIRMIVPCPDLTDDDIVETLNELERKIYRELTLPDKINRVSSTPTSPYYDLPSDCPEDRLQNVVIDGREYVKVAPNEENPPRYFCSVILGKLYIHPNPTDVKDVYLYYLPPYGTLSAALATQKPTMPEDYHSLLVYGCAQWIASLQRDVDMVNNMQTEYAALLTDAKKNLRTLVPTHSCVQERW